MLSSLRLLTGLTVCLDALFSGSIAVAQTASEIWQDASEPVVVAGKRAPVSERTVVPSVCRTLHLNWDAFRKAVAAAPVEFGSAESAAELPLPMPDGTFARFIVEESPIMEPKLDCKEFAFHRAAPETRRASGGAGE